MTYDKAPRVTPQLRARVLVEPTAEPVSLEAAREHLRVTPYLTTSDGLAHPDDALIQALITAAREHCEAFTGLSFVRKTYEAATDRFPPNGEPLELLFPPLLELQSLAYGPGSGEALSVSDVEVDEWSCPQRVFVAGDWPNVEPSTARIRIQYEAGYAPHDADSSEIAKPLPFAARAALLLLLGHLYENREATVERALQELPLGVEALLRPLRVNKGMA